MLDPNIFKATKFMTYRLPEDQAKKRYNWVVKGSGKERHREETDELVGIYDRVLLIKPASNTMLQIVTSLTKDHKDWVESITLDGDTITVIGTGSLIRRLFCLMNGG